VAGTFETRSQQPGQAPQSDEYGLPAWYPLGVDRTARESDHDGSLQFEAPQDSRDADCGRVPSLVRQVAGAGTGDGHHLRHPPVFG